MAPGSYPLAHLDQLTPTQVTDFTAALHQLTAAGHAGLADNLYLSIAVLHSTLSVWRRANAQYQHVLAEQAAPTAQREAPQHLFILPISPDTAITGLVSGPLTLDWANEEGRHELSEEEAVVVWAVLACGRNGQGWCQQMGTEHCEWHCPYQHL